MFQSKESILHHAKADDWTNEEPIIDLKDEETY